MQVKKEISIKKTIASFPQIFWGILLLGFVFSILSGNFLTGRNLLNILQQGSFLIVICMGVIIVKIMGGIELSVGGVMSLAGMVMAYTIVNFHFSVFGGILAAVVVGALAGGFNGIFVEKMNVPSFIATLGMQYIAVSLALVINDGNVIWGLPKEVSAISKSSILGIPFLIFITIFAVLFTFIILRYTVLGSYFYAIGGNEEALKLSGKKSWVYKIIGYSLSGIFAAIAGVLMTIRMQAAQPTIGIGMEFEAFSSCVLGGAIAAGKGDAIGALLGALFIIVLRSGLNNIGISTFYQLAIIGMSIIVSIVITIFLNKKINGTV